MNEVDKKELAELICDEPGFDAVADLLMALAQDKPIEATIATLKLEKLARQRYYELSGEKAADEWLAGIEHDDCVASVMRTAAA